MKNKVYDEAERYLGEEEKQQSEAYLAYLESRAISKNTKQQLLKREKNGKKIILDATSGK